MKRMNGPAFRRLAGLGLALLAAGMVVACGTPNPQLGTIPTLTVVPTRPPATATAPPPTVTAVPTAVIVSTPTVAPPTDDQGFADPAFRTLWEASDRPIAIGQASRVWLWGPKPFAVRAEPYSQAPGGTRLVQYFDKSRMEINDPQGDRKSQWFVTNGLLTVELVSGRVQTGLTTFDNLEPAQIPVAGDLESPDAQTPRYADFATIASIGNTNRAPQQIGAAVTTRLVRGGATQQEAKPPAGVRIAAYDDTLGHNLPDVFATYLQRLDVNWVFVTGYPISEPYWVVARSGGETQMVLVQLFERRALTYNPRNKAGWQVEWANIGLHYFRWRYHDR